MLAMVFATFMSVPYIAPYLQANCGLSSKNLPVIYGVAGVFSLVFMNIVGWLTDRFGPRPVFAMTPGGDDFGSHASAADQSVDGDFGYYALHGCDIQSSCACSGHIAKNIEMKRAFRILPRFLRRHEFPASARCRDRCC